MVVAASCGRWKRGTDFRRKNLPEPPTERRLISRLGRVGALLPDSLLLEDCIKVSVHAYLGGTA